jgi:hypothetical protein
MRRATVSLALVVVVSGCGEVSMSVSEYAAAAETLVVEMESDFERIEAHWTSSPATVEGAVEYWEHRLEIRHEFLEGIRDLVPPESLVGMHEMAIDIFGRLNAADFTAAESVREYQSIGEHWQWDYTPEGRAVLVIMDEVYSFCRAAQADFDAAAQGSAFEDLPWTPSEMTEEVSVALGCPPP